MLCDRWGVELLTRDDALVGSMSTVPLPGALSTMSEPHAMELQKLLYHRHGIEIPVVPWQGKWHVRISCQVYNAPPDYERLASTIAKILNEIK